MRRLCALVVGLMVSLAFVTVAQARTVEYLSQHPVPHKFGGGFCYIEIPHVHNYPPDDPRMYRENNGQFYFVGDPAPFNYDGPRYSYYGAHPVVDAEVQLGHPIYCYIKGPHYHWYQPPSQAQFQLSGGAYWYVGNFPPSYYDERPRYGAINAAYAPMPYARPVVDVQVAPPSVRAELSIGGPGWRAGAVVGGPPAPVYVAPPPPPGPPVQIGVGINLGGPAVIERREYIEERDYGRHEGWRDDHGRHEGWRDDRGRHEGWRDDHGRHEGWREEPHFQERGHRPAPARYAPVPAPVNAPLLHRAPPQNPGPGARFAPAPAPMRGPAPTQPGHTVSPPSRGPAPTAQAKHDDPRHR